MIAITVTKTQQASPDGVHIQEYEAGATYEMPEALAQVFLEQKWGARADEKKSAKGPRENK